MSGFPGFSTLVACFVIPAKVSMAVMADSEKPTTNGIYDFESALYPIKLHCGAVFVC